MAARNAATGLSFHRIWHLIDARQQTLGRMAVAIADTLMGKHKPIYDPSQDCGDHVIVAHAREIHLSGRKRTQLVYQRKSHPGRVGAMKEVSVREYLAHNPAFIIKHAVAGMLPKNRLRKCRLDRLHVFAEKVPSQLAANAGVEGLMTVRPNVPALYEAAVKQQLNKIE